MNTAEPNAQSRSSRLGHPRDQPLALGLFSTNIIGSTIMTTAPTSFELSWEHSTLIATMADRMGLDFLVSVARWSGFDGPSRFATDAFEQLRSDERRVGKECVSTCRHRWSTTR